MCINFITDNLIKWFSIEKFTLTTKKIVRWSFATQSAEKFFALIKSVIF